MSPTKFGRYEIKSEIGRGGMATVFHAYDPRFERDVAIKVLPREFLHDPQFRARFEREAKTIALIEHPAIVPVYDFGEEDGQPYIVMRYMSGGSLADRLEKGPLSIQEITQLYSRLAPALDAAHARGIIHRDLKPGNVLFDQYGNACLSDFGIARIAEASSSNLTGTAVLGTPAYMSPEQVQGDKELDGRSDLYAFGIILYQLLTGAMPYQADTPAKIMVMHLIEPVPQIRKVKIDLPPAFDPLVAKALAKDPNDRYATATELAAAIETAARGDPLATPFAPGATRLATGVKGEKPSAGKTVATGRVAAPVRAKIGIPIWAWAVGGLAGFGVLAIIGGFVLLPMLTGGSVTPTREAIASRTPEPIAVVSPEKTSTTTPTSPPEITDTPLPIVTPLPSDTPQPPTLTSSPTTENTPTQTLAPSETTTPATPTPPVLGGADAIAFLENNDIWVAYLDGSEMRQLTTDGAEKFNLQWTPDSQSLVYTAGKCILTAEYETGKVDVIACFEYADSLDAFTISPDGLQAAISLSKELYVISYNLEQLSRARGRDDIKAMTLCAGFAPLKSVTGSAIPVKGVRWSADMTRLGVEILGVSGSRQVDVIDVLDYASCTERPLRLDEFPATRFTITGYDVNPVIHNFAWDGNFLFSLSGSVRNGGFGDLYVYNTDNHKGEKINPIEGVCCYRDPSWSPDGRFLAFAFQDLRLADKPVTRLYIVQFGSIGTGMTFTALPLPEGFLVDRFERPSPVLRPVQ